MIRIASTRQRRSVPAPARTVARAAATAAIAAAAAVVVLTLALLPLLLPPVVHALLDRADSSAYLTTTAAVTHQWSDRTVSELVLGSGAFGSLQEGGVPFYRPDEVAHLRDVQALLRGLLLTAGMGLVTVLGCLRYAGDRRWVRRAVAAGATGLVAAVAVTVLTGVTVGFDRGFTVFHAVVFPQGNTEFPWEASRLVRLYPPMFWMLFASGWGAVTVVLSLLVRSAARRGSGRDRVGPTSAATRSAYRSWP